MRFLLTSQPGYGHLTPMFGLAHALQTCGHDVAFATAASYQGLVERAGFRHFSAGLDWDESRLYETIPEITRVHKLLQPDWLATKIFYDRAPKAMVPDLLDIVHRWQPDLIIANSHEPAGRIAAELVDLPFAGHILDFRDTNWQFRHRFPQLYEHFGIAELANLNNLERYLELHMLPPGWHFNKQFQNKLTYFCFRPQFWHDSQPLPDNLIHEPSWPNVHITLGTAFNDYPTVLKKLVNALQTLPINLTVSIGQQISPELFTPSLPNVFIEKFIPHTLLFPHLDVVISHGGYGTIMKALQHAVPLILLPTVGPFKAVCQRHNICVLSDMKPHTMQAALREMLQAAAKEKAIQLQKQLIRLPTVDAAVTMLERLVQYSQPINATVNSQALK